MPAKKLVPDLRYHSPSAQWYAWADGKRHHFGGDKQAATEAYARWASARLAGVHAGEPADPPIWPRLATASYPRSLAGVFDLYRIEAEKIYADQKQTLARIGEAVAATLTVFPGLPADQFRGPQLKAVREWLVHARRSKRDGGPLSRRYVNHLVGSIQQAWTWAVSEELVPGDSLAGIQAVGKLRRGRGGRETGHVPPPPDNWRETLAVLPARVAAMCDVQFLAAMRPQDVCRMRRKDISTTPAEKVGIPGTVRQASAVAVGDVLVWLYCPGDHKTAWRDKPRVIAIGPRAQKLLVPLVAECSPDDPVFSPRKTIASLGRTPWPGVGEAYSPRGYAQAVEQGNARAKGVPHWAPNQLRHLAATLIRERYDRDTAAAVLGHSSGATIDCYLERCVSKAARVAAEMG